MPALYSGLGLKKSFANYEGIINYYLNFVSEIYIFRKIKLSKNVLKPIATVLLMESASLTFYLCDISPEITQCIYALTFICEAYYGHALYKAWQNSGKDFVPFLKSNLPFFNGEPNRISLDVPAAQPLHSAKM